ncbi:uncharacterized protein LOC108675180 isoform X2 [Hyalella azteca]|uniref:Uncharacterized protein LOC108675180 isoform X2 n=1 Tax=Hyalella azteca TaxID=294128 RepID=A0A979FFU8_HYAAZ|nr:uncharacterized protein LOC108675180 isoform X2 [Hyalella azteca]
MDACTVCLEKYNGTDKKPLSLRCGHVFCRSCLYSLAELHNRRCPQCRRPWTEDVSELRVIYMLIDGEQEPFCQGCEDEMKAWFITGEQQAQEAMIQLESHQSRKNFLLFSSNRFNARALSAYDVQERPAFVVSTAANPIRSLSLLLIKLAEAGYRIRLYLNDSFLSRELPELDCARLAPFLQKGYGLHVSGFLGHASAATLQKMPRAYFSLRLETAADIEALYLETKFTEAAVNRNLKPEDIKHRPRACSAIQCVELQDSEVPWLVAVAKKLLVPDRNGLDEVREAAFVSPHEGWREEAAAK